MKKHLGETIAPKQGAPPQIGFIFESNMSNMILPGHTNINIGNPFLNFLPEPQAINLDYIAAASG